jgi:hypothetical protein
MLLHWRRYNKLRKGTIRLQATIRGRNQRREKASIEVGKYYRRHNAFKKFKRFKSAVIALQCRTRERTAKSLLFELKKEQKDVGKLKQNNEKLKEEMASLRAMLSAQAKQGAADSAHAIELAAKEKQIADLEKRIAQIEKELEEAKALIEKLEMEAKRYHEESVQDKETIRGLQSRRPGVIHTRSGSFIEDPPSPGSRRKRNISGDSGIVSALSQPPPGVPANYVSPEELAKHRSKVAILEEELEAERKFRRQADGEIIKLRAKVNGVELNDDDVNDLLAQRLDTPRSEMVSEESSFADEPSTKLRYIIVTLVVLLIELFCVAMLLRRRAFLRVYLRLLTEMEYVQMPNHTETVAFDWSEDLLGDVLLDHRNVEYFHMTNIDAN